MERQTLVRVLIAVAILVPLVVEGFTLLGLIGVDVGGGGESPADSTPTPDPVRVGDELFPDTAPAETLQTASISSTNDDWRLTLSVRVENADDGAYSLRLVTVTTDGGKTIDPSAGEAEIELGSGESGSVTAQWTLPQGTRPASLTVVTVRTPPNGSAEDPVRRTVTLAPIPVQG